MAKSLGIGSVGVVFVAVVVAFPEAAAASADIPVCEVVYEREDYGDYGV